ncbi:MAG: DUF5320 domain-containing protein [Candidatus Thorarchaeota archaeon]
MPNLDGTGPRGYGTKTGRQLGPCSTGIKRIQYPRYRYKNFGYRNRRYWNRHPRNFGKWDYPIHTHHFWPIAEWENPEDEKKFINQELKMIDKQKEELNKRLKDLDTKEEKK